MIGTILAIFDLQVTLMLPTKFPIGTILAIFDLQVTPMLPTKYQVNWPRCVGGVGF